MRENFEPWIRFVGVLVGGRRLWMCFDFAAIALAESKLPVRASTVCLLDGLPKMDLQSARALFAASVMHCQPEMCFDEAARMVDVSTMSVVVPAIREAWVASFPEIPKGQRRQWRAKPKGAVPTRAERWQEVQTTAQVELQMGWSELQKITPMTWKAYLDAVQRKAENATALMEFMLAQLTAMVANTGFRGWEEARQPAEFMPSEWRRKAEQEEALAARPRRVREREFDRQMERTMERATRYQSAQVGRDQVADQVRAAMAQCGAQVASSPAAAVSDEVKGGM